MSIITIGCDTFPGNFMQAAASDAGGDGVIINLYGHPYEEWSTLRDSEEARGGVVVVSSCSVYGCDSGVDIPASTPANATDESGLRFLNAESSIIDECRERGLKVAVLRTADMIGTGMTGRWRETANGIYRATFHHIRGNKALVSAVHAKDVAAMAVKAIGMEGTFIVTDGCVHTLEDVSEALSFRMSHKRIPVYSEKQARLEALAADIFSLGVAKRRLWLERQLKSLTFDGKPLISATGHTPVNVVEYLKTHDYSDEDI